MSVLTKEDRDWFRSYLSEGMHTAFRKGSDHIIADAIWRAIRDLPHSEWVLVVEFVASGMIEGLEQRLTPTGRDYL